MFPGGIESDQQVNLTKQNINRVYNKSDVLHDSKSQTLTEQVYATWNFVNFDTQKLILNIPSKGNYGNFSLIWLIISKSSIKKIFSCGLFNDNSGNIDLILIE